MCWVVDVLGGVEMISMGRWTIDNGFSDRWAPGTVGGHRWHLWCPLRELSVINHRNSLNTNAFMMSSRSLDYRRQLKDLYQRGVGIPLARATAPDAADILAPVTVGWDGPGARGDRIELWDPDALGGEGRRWRNLAVDRGDMDAKTVRMDMPARAGAYELRYVHEGEVIATRPITAAEVEVSLSAESPSPAARPIVVTWEGPGARYDEVQLWDPDALGGEGRRLHAKRLRNDDYDGRKVTLPGPAEPGTYELRYWNGDNRTVMATATIEITEIAVSLSAPDSVEAGRTFDVTWDGPGNRNDHVTFAQPGADPIRGASYAYSGNSKDGTVTVNGQRMR